MDDAIKALKTVAAVSRPGGPIHQAAAAGIRALDDERAAREQAERDRDRALVSAAVLLRAAREALGKYGRHFPLMCHAPNGGPCNCGLDDARKALEEKT